METNPSANVTNAAAPALGVTSQASESPPTSPEPRPAVPQLVVVPSVRNDEAQPKARSVCARQRLEDQFRQTFLEQHPRGELAPARIVEPAATVNGRTS
jgi:hypothetical protein